MRVRVCRCGAFLVARLDWHTYARRADVRRCAGCCNTYGRMRAPFMHIHAYMLLHCACHIPHDAAFCLHIISAHIQTSESRALHIESTRTQCTCAVLRVRDVSVSLVPSTCLRACVCVYVACWLLCVRSFQLLYRTIFSSGPFVRDDTSAAAAAVHHRSRAISE